MRGLIGMKTMADLCFLAAFLSVVPYFKGDNVFLVALILCGGLSMGLSGRLEERGILRFLPFVLVVIPLFLNHDTVHCIFVGLVALYILALICGRGYQIEHWRYVTQSKVMIVLMLVILFAALVRDDNVPVTFAYMFLFLALTSFVLRQSRLGRYADHRSGVLNVLYLVGCCVIAIVLSALLTGLSTFDWDAVAQVLFTPFAILLYGLAALYHLIGKGIKRDEMAEENTKELLDLNDKELQEYAKEATANAGDGPDFTMPHLGKVLAVILILLLIALVVYIFYRFVKHLMEQNTGLRQETIFETEKVGTYGEGKKRITGNRKKIRKFYRNYMTLLRSRGADINRCMTTEEMRDANPDDSRIEEENKLREIYLKARYDEQTQPENKDVQEIKELVDRIRKKDN